MLDSADPHYLKLKLLFHHEKRNEVIPMQQKEQRILAKMK